MAAKWIYWVEELGKEDNDLVGKKCANLGEIAKAGLPIPKGFCLSVDAYGMFMDLTGTTEEIEKEINEFIEERPHIEAIDVAESIYKDYEE